MNNKQKGARGEREITIDTCQPIPSKTGEQTIAGEDDNAHAQGYTRKNDADLTEYKTELERRRQGWTDD